MSNTYADATDVDTLWDAPSFLEPANPDLIDRVGRLLVYAHALLKSKAAGLDAKVADGSVDADVVQMLICDAVIRVLNNPKGVLGQSVGEASFYFSQSGAKYGGITFSDDDLALLGASSTSVMAKSVRMASPYAVIRTESWRC